MPTGLRYTATTTPTTFVGALWVLEIALACFDLATDPHVGVHLQNPPPALPPPRPGSRVFFCVLC